MTDAAPPLPRLGAGELPPLPTLGPVNRGASAGGARRDWQRAEVVEIRRETADALTFGLALPDGKRHTPGQHYVVRVSADDGSIAQRSYSVASAPQTAAEFARDGGVRIELTVERIADGDVSPYLHDEVGVGDQVEVRGPFGGWFVWPGGTPALLLGGGSGVVPLMSMLRWWRATGSREPLALIQSVRAPGDLFYAGQYGEETTLVWTGQPPVGATRPSGRLDAATLEPVLAPLRDIGVTVFVCGSAGFAEHASQLAVTLGVAAGSVRVERFGPA